MQHRCWRPGFSEILVGAAEGAGKALGISPTFIGIVLLAIVGGAAESGSAIAMARKNKMDLTVAPALVLGSYFIAPQPLDLSFQNGQWNWFKGVQLITVYFIIALMFFVTPGL